MLALVVSTPTDDEILPFFYSLYDPYLDDGRHFSVIIRDIREKIHVIKDVRDERIAIPEVVEVVEEKEEDNKSYNEEDVIERLMHLSIQVEYALSAPVTVSAAVSLKSLATVMKELIMACEGSSIVAIMAISAAEFIKIACEKYYMFNNNVTYNIKNNLILTRNSDLFSYLNSEVDLIGGEKKNNYVNVVKDTLSGLTGLLTSNSSSLPSVLADMIEDSYSKNGDYVNDILYSFAQDYLRLSAEDPFSYLVILSSLFDTCLQVVDRDNIIIKGSH